MRQTTTHPKQLASQNASFIAGMILSINSLIVEKKEKSRGNASAAHDDDDY